MAREEEKQSTGEEPAGGVQQQLIMASSSEDGILVGWGIRLPTFVDGLATGKQGSKRSFKEKPLYFSLPEPVDFHS